MEKDWILLYSAGKPFQAEIIKEMLEENGIPAIVINKQDSSYLIGEAEIFVHESNREKAVQLINSLETE